MSVLAGTAAAYLAMAVLPCAWFGSNFEGACAYGALWFAIGIGVLVAAALFSYLAYRVMRSFSGAAGGADDRSKVLGRVWIVTLVLLLASPLLGVTGLGDMMTLPVAALTLAAYAAASAVLAQQRGKHPAIVLLVLIPWIGAILVAVLLHLPSAGRTRDV